MRSASTRSIPFVLFLVAFPPACEAPRAQDAPHHHTVELPLDRATVPLVVEGNRPYVEVTFRHPDGSAHAARLLVDTGGGGFLLTEPLARAIGLEWGATRSEEGMEFARAKSAPDAAIGGLALELDAGRIAVVLGRESILPPAAPGHADGMLPGHVLARHHVVFDYPRATFTIARPGVLTPRGDAVPMPVGNASGFPRTEIEVDGETYGLLLDTGAAFTMVSETLLKAWSDAHPDWPRHPGAFGEAKLLGGQTLETLFVPRARWGTHALAELGVTSQREGVFEGWMSSMTALPIAGALAGNVLRDFRVELDYANETLYLSKP